MLTGLEFLAQARKIQADASRILVTAVVNVGTVIDAISKAEIFRFLLEPWQREELWRTVQEAVERYETLCRHRILLTTMLAMNDTLTKLAQGMTTAQSFPAGRPAQKHPSQCPVADISHSRCRSKRSSFWKTT